jgi:hypothetical protein
MAQRAAALPHKIFWVLRLTVTAEFPVHSVGEDGVFGHFWQPTIQHEI